MTLYEVFNIIGYYHGDDNNYANVIVEYDPKNERFKEDSPESLLECTYTDSASDTWRKGDVTVHPDPNFENYENYKGNLHWDDAEYNKLHEIYIEISDIIVLPPAHAPACSEVCTSG